MYNEQSKNKCRLVVFLFYRLYVLVCETERKKQRSGSHPTAINQSETSLSIISSTFCPPSHQPSLHLLIPLQPPHLFLYPSLFLPLDFSLSLVRLFISLPLPVSSSLSVPSFFLSLFPLISCPWTLSFAFIFLTEA